MTNPTQAAPPSAPAPPTPRTAVATLSRELGDFLVELSITLNKHAIYPSKHPLLDVAIDGVANRLGLLFDEHRDSLSIGVARKQLIIEGVATDPLNPVLKELAQRLHKHHVGAVKFIRGINREELADALATLSVDPLRAEKPIGHDTERLTEKWAHVKFFPLTYDRLQLIEDDGTGERPKGDQAASSRAVQLWIGLARAALVTDANAPASQQPDESTALEPATVAKAIDEHQREEAYDQVIVGYLLQIGEELRAAEGPEAAGLQRRVSRLVGSLKDSTLEKLLEMGGDKNQRRQFLLDASAGITVEAVIDLVKAASAAEGQTISHSMLRMLTKLGNHPGSVAPRGKTDPMVRDVMRRLIDDWSLDDPNPEGYRNVLQNMSAFRTAAPNGKPVATLPTECEPERLVEMAIEIGTTGPQVQDAMVALCQSGRAELLLDLVERAPSADAGAPVWDFLVRERIFELVLAEERPDIDLVRRFVHRIGVTAVPLLVSAATSLDDGKMRVAFYELIESIGDEAAPMVADRIPEGFPLIQRELLAMLGRFKVPASGFSAAPYASSSDALVRREALRLMLRDASARDNAIMTAIADADDRVVFVGLQAAQDKCPAGALHLIRERVDRDELDSQLRTMGIRIVAHQARPEILAWLVRKVVTEARWPRRPKLKPSTPEMLAALGALSATWRSDPEAAAAIKLAEHSKDETVRAKVSRGSATKAPGKES